MPVARGVRLVWSNTTIPRRNWPENSSNLQLPPSNSRNFIDYPPSSNYPPRFTELPPPLEIGRNPPFFKTLATALLSPPVTRWSGSATVMNDQPSYLHQLLIPTSELRHISLLVNQIISDVCSLFQCFLTLARYRYLSLHSRYRGCKCTPHHAC